MLILGVRLKDHRRKVRLVDGVRESLRLEAEAMMPHIACPALAPHTIQEVAAVKLHPWRSREDCHRAARLGILERGGKLRPEI